MNSSPDLDFTSDLFDPVKALASRSVCLPFPKAKTYNNLAEYYTNTVLKKNKTESSKKNEVHCERNYVWYFKTLGFREHRANFFLEKLRAKRSRNRRKGKKPIPITYVSCSPLRSEKVIELESNFKKYWKRKRLLYKKNESRSLFQKIKLLAKPLSATELIKKAIQNCPSQTLEIENESSTCLSYSASTNKISTTIPLKQAEIPVSTSQDNNANAVLPSKEQSKTINSKSSQVKRQHSPKKQFLGKKSKSRHISKRRETSASYSNSSQHQTEQDNIANSNFKQNIPEITLGKNQSDLQTKESFRDCVKLVNESSIKVKINCKLITTKSLKSKEMKKDTCMPINHCTCIPKISVELSSQCKCGTYNTAMKNLRKFKIPRKKPTIS